MIVSSTEYGVVTEYSVLQETQQKSTEGVSYLSDESRVEVRGVYDAWDDYLGRYYSPVLWG